MVGGVVDDTRGTSLEVSTEGASHDPVYIGSKARWDYA